MIRENDLINKYNSTHDNLENEMNDCFKQSELEDLIAKLKECEIEKERLLKILSK